MLESRKFLNPRGVAYLEMGTTALHCSWNESNLLYLTVEIALPCFLNKSLVITGRFDGPSLILTLSAVKHLGKDNNSQFYDTVRGGRRGVSSLPLWSFRTVQRKKAVHLGQHRNHPALWNQPARSLNMWSQVAFDVFIDLEQLALSCWPLRNCASGRLVTINFSQSRNCAKLTKFSSWGKAVHGAALNLVWNAAQLCCFSLCCALVLVGCIPTLLFTDQSARLVQARAKSSNLEHVVRCCNLSNQLLQCCSWHLGTGFMLTSNHQ